MILFRCRKARLKELKKESFELDCIDEELFIQDVDVFFIQHILWARVIEKTLITTHIHAKSTTNIVIFTATKTFF